MPRLIDHDARRQQLAEATWRVIMRDGVGGASVRSVAAEAGRSPGSLRHVFATQSALLVHALELVVDRAAARIAALPPDPDAVATVVEVAAQLLPLDAVRRAEMEVYQALFNAANTEPHLRGPRDRAHLRVRDACTWMINHLDEADVIDADVDRDLEAQHLHALIDGLAMHLICEPPDVDPAWAHQILVRHVHSLAGIVARRDRGWRRP